MHKKIVVYQSGSQIAIILKKCSPYGIKMIVFWSFFGIITYSKDNIFFQKTIIQWQIQLISYRSEFWHLRRKFNMKEGWLHLRSYSNIDCFETNLNDKWPILRSLPAIFCQLYEHLSQNWGSGSHFKVLSRPKFYTCHGCV